MMHGTSRINQALYQTNKNITILGIHTSAMAKGLYVVLSHFIRPCLNLLSIITRLVQVWGVCFSQLWRYCLYQS